MTNNQRGVLLDVTWFAFGLTVVVQVIAISFFLARLESGLAELRTTHSKAESTIQELRLDVRRAEAQVQYLCNERRRDNLEANRTDVQVC